MISDPSKTRIDVGSQIQGTIPLRADIHYLLEKDKYDEPALWLLQRSEMPLHLKQDPSIHPLCIEILTEAAVIRHNEGYDPLYIGFPLLISKSRSLAAPLAYFPVRLKRQYPQGNWFLEHDLDRQPFYNEDIVTSAQQKGMILPSEMIAQQMPKSIGTWENWCTRISDALELSSASLNFSLFQEIPKQYTNYEGWYSSLGLYLFSPQWTGNIPEENDQEEVEFEPIRPLELNYHSLNPEQAQLLRTASQESLTWATGPKGSGKSHTLLEMVLQFWSQGKRVLVLNDFAPSLANMYATFQKLQIDGQSIFLTEWNQSPHLIRQQIEGVGKQTKQAEVMSDLEYDSLMRQWIRNTDRIQRMTNDYEGQQFGEAGWEDIVGKFMEQNQSGEKALLNSQLNPLDFTFVYSEYEQIRNDISEVEPHYPGIRTLQHPLNHLNSHWFTNIKPEEAKSSLQNTLLRLKEHTLQLHHRYIKKIDSYTHELGEHYFSYERGILDFIENIQDTIADGKVKFGQSFSGELLQGRPMLSVFSTRSKQINAIRTHLEQAYQNLFQFHRDRPYIDYELPAWSAHVRVNQLERTLSELETVCKHWRLHLSAHIQDHVQRLNHKTVHPELDFKEQIKALEYDLDLLVEELNDAKIFQKSLQNNRLTIPQRQQFLESIIEQLEELQYQLRDFDFFYLWQRKWLELSELSCKVVRALVKVRPSDWVRAFDSWYLYHKLIQCSSDFASSTSRPLSELGQINQALTPAFWNRKARTLQKAQQKAWKKWPKKERQQWSKTSVPFLPPTFKSQWKTLSQVFPIWFMTPKAAIQLLPEAIPTHTRFDLVIWDDASTLDQAKLNTIRAWGVQCICAGSQHQTQAELPTLKLPSRSTYAPVWADFINGIFPHQAIIRTSASKNFRPSFQIIEHGQLPSEEALSNTLEAQRILRDLQGLEEGLSIGICCLSIEQRNLVYSLFDQMIERKAAGFERLETLRSSGLLIFAPEDLTNHSFDQVWLSTGVHPAQFSQLKTETLAEQLKTVCLAAQYGFRIYLADQANFSLTANESFEASILLGKMVQYLQALKQPASAFHQTVLQRIFPGWKVPAPPPPSILTEQIYQYLKPYFEEGRLQKQWSINFLNVPIALLADTKEQKPALLLIDGFLNVNHRQSPVWAYQLYKQLKEEGYTLYTTQSASWWKNPQQEARRLASRLIRGKA